MEMNSLTISTEVLARSLLSVDDAVDILQCIPCGPCVREQHYRTRGAIFLYCLEVGTVLI